MLSRIVIRKETSMTANSPQSNPSRPGARVDVPQAIRQEIVNLHAYYGSREICLRVALSRKIVRRVLAEEGALKKPAPTKTASKLEPFHSLLKEKVATGLSVSRILREIRAQGYQGGRSILAAYVQTLRGSLSPSSRGTVKRRFETPPGEEMQIDWSPYRVSIAGVNRVVHAFGCLLCSSRKLWVHFYSNERQATLLEAIASAFEYFLGCALRLVLDNMATAVLGRWGPNGQPVWHPRFLDFARHYGFQPYACAVQDPDRKGKKEKSFRLLWEDFLKGCQFDSLEDLNQRLALWLDGTPEVANQRVHGTTRQVPNQAWLSERQFLIQLPDKRFPVFEQSIRLVDQDSTLSIDGTRYSVPASLARRSVAVHLFAEHFEILDSHHHVLFSRRYAAEADKGKLLIDPTHYANLPRRPHAPSSKRLDQAFLIRFPALQPFIHGLQLRMKNLAPVHIRALLRLHDAYGQDAFLEAVRRAQEYRRFDARAVQRILEREFPLPDLSPIASLGGIGTMLLDNIASGSLDDYGGLDGDVEAPKTIPTKPQEKDHGA
jgi:transposase